MGLFKEECTGIKCDSCGEIYENICGFSLFPYEGDAINDAREDNWQEIDGKWYCPKCCHPEAKDGDFLVTSTGNCFICKLSDVKCRYGCYAGEYENLDINYQIAPAWTLKSVCRPATEEEKEIFLSKLHKVGKDWDADKKEIVEYKKLRKHIKK